MKQTELTFLQSRRDVPAVSILMPTHRTHPDNQQDPIRLRNLIADATRQLSDRFPKPEANSVIGRLNALAEQVDYRTTLDGLALFVSQEVTGKFYLPFVLQERVSVGEGFITRDLVFAFNRTPRYWVLVLSDIATRLYEGTRENLVEITEGGFPVQREGPGVTEPMPGGFGIRRSAYRDEYDRQFLRLVDAALHPLITDDPLPLIVLGVETDQVIFSDISRHTNLVVGKIMGSYEKTPPHELVHLTWPIMSAHLVALRDEVLNQLGQAVGARQYDSGLQMVWKATQEGRVATMIVEQDYRAPARIDSAHQQLLFIEQPSTGDMEDAVNDLIELVMAKGGRVVFVEKDTLKKYQRVAAILRH